MTIGSLGSLTQPAGGALAWVYSLGTPTEDHLRDPHPFQAATLTPRLVLLYFLVLVFFLPNWAFG